MTQALKAAVTKTLDGDGVSFIENGEDPGISFIENARTLMRIDHVTGNLRYALRLLGVGIKMNGRNGHKHNGREHTGDTETIDTETIIVPGYASRNHTFASLMDRLAEGGIDSNALREYDDFRIRAPFSAYKAAGVVCERIKDSTANEINLICHSMGGIIALLGCDQLEGEDRKRIKRIVTLGAPWKGTPLAPLLLLGKRGDEALQELSPNSKLVREDLPRVREDIRKRTVSIGSVADGIVPWQSSVLPGSPLNVVLRGRNAVTHANFLYDKRVAAAVRAILGN